LKSCRSCGVELGDDASFCHICGASQSAAEGPPAQTPATQTQQAPVPRTLFYVMIIALAIMGLVSAGLAVRSPGVVTETSYVTLTQMQYQTVSIGFTSSITSTATFTAASFSTVSNGPPPIWFNQPQYCGYPFNPYVCSEGPPVTITGYLTNDTTCVNLYVGSGQNYVVWNLPQTYPDGAYQIYGFVYPNWPPTQPFPPYPFQKAICVGIPLWAISPYIQTA